VIPRIPLSGSTMFINTWMAVRLYNTESNDRAKPKEGPFVFMIERWKGKSPWVWGRERGRRWVVLSVEARKDRQG